MIVNEFDAERLDLNMEQLSFDGVVVEIMPGWFDILGGEIEWV